MADAIQFTDMGGVIVLLAFAAVYLGSCYAHQKEK
jgi:hypothetical protein